MLSGRPGTGKTTLASALARRLRAAHLRIDAIEAAVVACGLATAPVGVVGYAAAANLARCCLLAGTPVVVDAVNPVAAARAGWADLATDLAVPLRMIETRVDHREEHRRRVETRVSDLSGLQVPTWAQASQDEYQPWDEHRDGVRLLLGTAEPLPALVRRAMAYLLDAP